MGGCLKKLLEDDPVATSKGNPPINNKML